MFAQATDDGITIRFDDGAIRSITSDHPNYQRILTKLHNLDIDGIRELADVSTAIETFSQGQLQVQDGRIFVGDEELPDEVLGEQIFSALREKQDLTPLVNYAESLMQNPDYHIVRGQLSRFLQANPYQISERGSILFPKGVTEDLYDMHSRSVYYGPGEIVEMPRRNVEKDPHKHCAPGLHVGSWDYAGGWGSACVMTEVYPEDIVSIPADIGGCSKLRCCRLRVLYRATDLEEERARAQTEGFYRDDFGEGFYIFEIVGLTADGEYVSQTFREYGSDRHEAESDALGTARVEMMDADPDTIRVRQVLEFFPTSEDETEDEELPCFRVYVVVLTDRGEVKHSYVDVTADNEDDALSEYDTFDLFPDNPEVDLGTMKPTHVERL